MMAFRMRPASLGTAFVGALALVTISLVPALGESQPALAARRSSPVPAAAHNPNGRFLGVVPSHGSAAAHAATAQRPAAAKSQLTYHGGPILPTSKVYAILWAPKGHAFPAAYEATVRRFLGAVARDSFKPSNPYSVATQYFSTNTGTKQFVSYSLSLQGVGVDTRPFPTVGGCPNYVLDDGSTTKTCLTAAQLSQELDYIVAVDHLTTGLGTQYVLLTPQWVGSCLLPDSLKKGGCYDPHAYNGFCAYHSFDLSSGTVVYATIPYAAIAGCMTGQSPNGNAADSALSTMSHEQIEMMTDPLGNSWYDAAGSEIGDKCFTSFGGVIGSTPSGGYNERIGGHGYWLQEEWSNRAHACVQRNTFPQPSVRFSWTPAQPRHGKAVVFRSHVKDSDDTSFKYSWDFGNGGASSVANPKTKYARAGTFTVTLIVFDAHGDQARVTRSIKVS